MYSRKNFLFKKSCHFDSLFSSYKFNYKFFNSFVAINFDNKNKTGLLMASSSKKKPKFVLNEQNPNYEICQRLLELAENEKTNFFKSNAYKKAANILNENVAKINSGSDAMKLRGIGKGIAAIIDQILSKDENNNDQERGPDRTRMAEKPKSNIDKPNYELAEMLLELADYEKNVNRQIYKHNAYRKVANEIMNCSFRIKTLEEAKKLEGVGESIAEKISEYLLTGTIQKLEQIRSSEDAIAIKELTRVTGIGPAAAHHFIKMNIRTIDDLKANIDLLNHQQQIGLKHLDDFEKRIPREEMLEIEKLLLKEIKNVDEKFDMAICGSFRRGLATSGDVDLLLTHPDYTSSNVERITRHRKGEVTEVSILLKEIVNRLEKVKFITDTLAFGDFKYMGVCKLNEIKPYRRIDIRLFPKDQYYLAVLYFTGSNVFNQNMRKLALERGFTLNEYSLRRLGSTGVPGKPLPISSEEDVFEYIGMEYRKPEDRTV